MDSSDLSDIENMEYSKIDLENMELDDIVFDGFGLEDIGNQFGELCPDNWDFDWITRNTTAERALAHYEARTNDSHSNQLHNNPVLSTASVCQDACYVDAPSGIKPTFAEFKKGIKLQKKQDALDKKTKIDEPIPKYQPVGLKVYPSTSDIDPFDAFFHYDWLPTLHDVEDERVKGAEEEEENKEEEDGDGARYPDNPAEQEESDVEVVELNLEDGHDQVLPRYGVDSPPIDSELIVAQMLEGSILRRRLTQQPASQPDIIPVEQQNQPCDLIPVSNGMISPPANQPLDQPVQEPVPQESSQPEPKQPDVVTSIKVSLDICLFHSLHNRETIQSPQDNADTLGRDPPTFKVIDPPEKTLPPLHELLKPRGRRPLRRSKSRSGGATSKSKSKSIDRKKDGKENVKSVEKMVPVKKLKFKKPASPTPAAPDSGSRKKNDQLKNSSGFQLVLKKENTKITNSILVFSDIPLPPRKTPFVLEWKLLYYKPPTKVKSQPKK